MGKRASYELVETERKKRPSHIIRRSSGRGNTANTVNEMSISDCLTTEWLLK